jgi:hypothetical protein
MVAHPIATKNTSIASAINRMENSGVSIFLIVRFKLK